MHSTSKSVSHHHRKRTAKRKGSILHRVGSAIKHRRAKNRSFQKALKKIGKHGSVQDVIKLQKKYYS